MSYHARTEQGHHGDKGASHGSKGASFGHLGVAGHKGGGLKTGTKLQPGTNFSQNVAIYEHWTHWLSICRLPEYVDVLRDAETETREHLLALIGEIYYNEG